VGLLPEHSGIEWNGVATWSDEHGYNVSGHYTDRDIYNSDQVRVEFTLPDGTHDYLTFHTQDLGWGMDDLERYVDNVIDESSYFEQ
jgi:hypothetical protein